MSERKTEKVFKKRIDPEVKAKDFTNGAFKNRRSRTLEVPSRKSVFKQVLLVILWVTVIVVVGAWVISSLNDVNIFEYLFSTFYADSGH